VGKTGNGTVAWSEEYYPDDTLPLSSPQQQILRWRAG